MMTEKEVYKNMMDKIISSEMKSLEVEHMKKNHGYKFAYGKIAVAVLVAMLIMGSGAVYAAKYGIFERILHHVDEQLESEVDMRSNLTDFEGNPVDTDNWYEQARIYGCIFPYELYINEMGWHNYRQIGTFDLGDLQQGTFNEDYTEITVAGETYHLMSPTLEMENLEEPLEVNPLWAIPMDNWTKRDEILVKEQLIGIRKGVVEPLAKGNVRVEDNHTGHVEILSAEDLANAKVDIAGDYVLIGDEAYIVNGSDESLRLRPAEDYDGDCPHDRASIEAAEYYTMEEWMAIEP